MMIGPAPMIRIDSRSVRLGMGQHRLNLPPPLRGRVGEGGGWGGGIEPAEIMARSVARQLRGNPTDAETKLWSRLRRKQLNGHRFRSQVPIDNYVADFACFESRLVIEVDGGQHAESTTDVIGTAFLEREGFRVLRFWNNEVLQNTDGVIDVIRAALCGDPPP